MRNEVWGFSQRREQKCKGEWYPAKNVGHGQVGKGGVQGKRTGRQTPPLVILDAAPLDPQPKISLKGWEHKPFSSPFPIREIYFTPKSPGRVFRWKFPRFSPARGDFKDDAWVFPRRFWPFPAAVPQRPGWDYFARPFWLHSLQGYHQKNLTYRVCP